MSYRNVTVSGSVNGLSSNDRLPNHYRTIRIVPIDKRKVSIIANSRRIIERRHAEHLRRMTRRHLHRLRQRHASKPNYVFDTTAYQESGARQARLADDTDPTLDAHFHIAVSPGINAWFKAGPHCRVAHQDN